MLSWFLKKKTDSTSHQQFKNNGYHLSTAREIIQKLELYNTINSIRRIVSIHADDFDSLYQPIIDRYLECCQLIPASSSYHHTIPGGLIIHTLNVAEYALSERKKHILPKFSDPETQQKEKHVWSYALFVAAFLHDIGKTLTQQSLHLSDGTLFNPFSDINTTLYYELEFKKTKESYRLHKQLSSLFFSHIVPTRGQIWLGEYLHILDELTATLQGVHEYSGAIGKIIQKADSRSVSESTGLYNSSRFLGAQPPLSEKIMLAVRQIIPTLGINKSGGACFKQGDKVWILSKILADSIRDFLKNHNESVPYDNNRVFDELEHSGLAIKGDSGIVQRINVHIPEVDFNKNFTAIALDIRKVYDALSVPQDINGSISLQSNNIATMFSSTDQDDSTVTLQETATVYEDISNNNGAIDKASKTSNPWILYPLEDEPTLNQNSQEDEGSMDENATISLMSEYDSIDNASSQKHESRFIKWHEVDLPLFPEECAINSKQAGEIFIQWLKLMVKHRRYNINENDSAVHKLLDYYLGILVPSIFLDFCKDYNLGVDNYNRIRNGVRKAGYLISHGKRREIFLVKPINQEHQLHFCIIHEKHLLESGTNISVNKSLVLYNKPNII